MNRVNDIRDKAIITKETMEYFQEHGQTSGFEFLTANDFRYLLSKIDGLQSQLTLSTEREERYKKALEEISKSDYVATVGGDMRRLIAIKALNFELYPDPEPVTVDELEEKAYFALANYDSSKEACYLENFNPYKNRTAQAKAVIAYILSTFTITRKP